MFVANSSADAPDEDDNYATQTPRATESRNQMYFQDRKRAPPKARLLTHIPASDDGDPLLPPPYIHSPRSWTCNSVVMEAEREIGVPTLPDSDMKVNCDEPVSAENEDSYESYMPTFAEYMSLMKKVDEEELANHSTSSESNGSPNALHHEFVAALSSKKISLQESDISPANDANIGSSRAPHRETPTYRDSFSRAQCMRTPRLNSLAKINPHAPPKPARVHLNRKATTDIKHETKTLKYNNLYSSDAERERKQLFAETEAPEQCLRDTAVGIPEVHSSSGLCRVTSNGLCESPGHLAVKDYGLSETEHCTDISTQPQYTSQSEDCVNCAEDVNESTREVSGNCSGTEGFVVDCEESTNCLAGYPQICKNSPASFPVGSIRTLTSADSEHSARGGSLMLPRLTSFTSHSEVPLANSGVRRSTPGSPIAHGVCLPGQTMVELFGDFDQEYDVPEHTTVVNSVEADSEIDPAIIRTRRVQRVSAVNPTVAANSAGYHEHLKPTSQGDKTSIPNCNTAQHKISLLGPRDKILIAKLLEIPILYNDVQFLRLHGIHNQPANATGFLTIWRDAIDFS
ncbi:hypothetical protein SARC_00270 [Sphaeroforma arctica JP610]|uniref:Uncharacterized protein n=1 Tax=Sphaeroforma arctica JP610 TaxID=667725 RepID=A0A0L0GF28_9EUKA|nr:hypothetical protein SARC_00270 [Sphaeroforma arctica JP610]KNC87640.1 hypothetical protein SARC_00270 [Sphaeroforma arctica JP610]|eukprot:XP_014161542.1 hypothetical protein SARC_00270 [Sphaeroforma arctica JP610]